MVHSPVPVVHATVEECQIFSLLLTNVIFRNNTNFTVLADFIFLFRDFIVTNNEEILRNKKRIIT